MTTSALHAGQRPAEGLYDPAHEHDACGVGFVVDIKGRKSHAIVDKAIQVLVNLLHRGACGCEPNTGDGAGIVIQMPDRFLRRECARIGVTLPPATEYGAGLVFLPRDAMQADKVRALLHSIVEDEGLRLSAGATCPPTTARWAPPRARSSPRSSRSSSATAHRGSATSPSSASSTSSASSSKKRWPPSTSRRTSSPTSRACPPTRSSTRACSAPTRSRRCSPTSPIPTWSRRWPSCTSGSAPTRFHRGRWPIRTGSWPTTARSTRCAGTSTGCGPGRRCAAPRRWATTCARCCRSRARG